MWKLRRPRGRKRQVPITPVSKRRVNAQIRRLVLVGDDKTFYHLHSWKWKWSYFHNVRCRNLRTEAQDSPIYLWKRPQGSAALFDKPVDDKIVAIPNKFMLWTGMYHRLTLLLSLWAAPKELCCERPWNAGWNDFPPPPPHLSLGRVKKLIKTSLPQRLCCEQMPSSCP